MKTYLERLTEGKSLTEQEMEEASGKLFSESVSDSEIAAFLVSLKAKGETVEELSGLVKTLRKHSLRFTAKVPNAIDNCGTGGDGSKSFNISTASAFVIAGAGIPVAKHGNRSVSSKTGSADVLEHLGVRLDLEVEATENILAETGIAFLFAPHVHPKIKRIMKVRKDLRIPTVFNLIGPLTNPIELDYQVLGIYRRDLTEKFAEVLKNLGRKKAVVLNGAGYMDEACLAGENQLVILDNGHISKVMLHPHQVNLPVYDIEEIRGGDSRENAEILLSILKADKGAHRDTVLLNAGIGIYTGGKAASIAEGVQLAAESIDSGAALEKLNRLVEACRKSAKAVI
ncbi:anthranilate phosphoribosyltransferase [Mesobacillus harenae]|uniref:anthranilate phosphoribosyltransferase n=1 Tax=Mesobacillus harenae TaxID=2213203 RepID=UPI001580D5D5|nr:anthranilate phosphoribosyltransferase [Mesobacillus harenae]